MSVPSQVGDDTAFSLLTRVKSQDADAWVQFAGWIGPFILRWCRRAGLQPADREEIAQQVLMSMWSGLGTLRRDRHGESFHGWAYTITRNCIRDLLARRQEGPGSLPAAVDPGEAAHLERRAIQLIVKDAVVRHAADAGFKAFYRTVVDGLSVPQVAAEQGLKPWTVRQHRSRWARRLRDRLRDEFGELLG
jgi:RNA polymerase sigma-70 factor, ECF subfamily